MADNRNLIDLSSEALVFYHVALLKGFRATAAHLGISKSVVSDKISSLERRLGRRLLFRSTRDVSLTVEGEIYFESCKNLFTATQKLNIAETSLKPGLNGSFTISAPHDFMTLWLVPALLKLQSRHPKLKLNLVAADQVLNLEKDKIDLAIRVGADGSNHLYRSSFFTTEFGFYCKSALALPKKSEQETLEWMREEGVLVFRPSREKSFRLHDNHEDVKVQTKFQVHDVLSLKSLILAGAGIGILPRFAVREELQAGIISEVLPAAKIKGLHFIFLSGVKRQDDARLNAVIEFLQEEAKSL